jgi:hypothetical protein
MFNEHGNISELSSLRRLRSSGVAAAHRGAITAPGARHALSAGARWRPVRCFGAPGSSGRRFLWSRGIERFHRSFPGSSWNSRGRRNDGAGLGLFRYGLGETRRIPAKGILPGLSFGMSDTRKRGACRDDDCSPRSHTDPSNPVQLQAEIYCPAGTGAVSLGRNVGSRGNRSHPDAGPGTSFANPEDRRSGMDRTVPKVGGYRSTLRIFSYRV